MIPSKPKVPKDENGDRRCSQRELVKYESPKSVFIQNDGSLIVKYEGEE